MAYEACPFPVILLQLDTLRQGPYLTHHYKMHDKMPLFVLIQTIYKGPGESSYCLRLQVKQSRNPLLFLLHTGGRVNVYKENNLLLLVLLDLVIILPSICRKKCKRFLVFCLQYEKQRWWSPCSAGGLLLWDRCCANPQEMWIVQRLIFRAGYRLVVEHLLSTSVAMDSIPSTAEISKNTYIHI